MSLRSSVALIKARRLALAGREKEAVSPLIKSIAAGTRDARLLIRKWLLTGDQADLEALAGCCPSSRAAGFFLAMAAFKNGDMEKAGKHLETAEKTAPGNMSVKALAAVVRARTGGAGELLRIGDVLPGAALDVQALALFEVEKNIASMDRSDNGAAEREETLGGPPGWILDRLDDLAVWIYWAIALALNAVLNLTNKKRRTVWRHVTDGDRLAGLGKKDEAAARYRTALDIDPGSVEALESLTAYHMERREYDKASACLEKLEREAGRGDEAPPLWRKWRADISFFSGQPRNARRIYAELAKILPLDYIIPYREGLCAARLGDVEGALRCFREALGRINPSLLRERMEKLGRLAAEN